ncbi:tyrosine-type recombinase/integrase [Bacillota bacterium Meth-B3]
MATKQKSGLYRSKVKIGVNADGKDMVKYISGKTKRELEDARRVVEAFYIAGTGLRDDRLFGEYAVEWYKNIREPDLSPSSRSSYRSIMNKHVLPFFGERNLRSITASELQKWYNGFAGKSDTTIALAGTVVRGVFTAALADRIIPSNPAGGLKNPKPGKVQERRSLTPKETEKALHLIATHEWGAYLACMYYLGVRPGEARGLMWGDFDWDRDLVHIQRDTDYTTKAAPLGELKTDAADREVPVPAELRAILWPRRGHPAALLFHGQQSNKPLSKASAERIWLEMLESVGLTVPKEEPKEGEGWKHPDIRSRLKPIITPHYLRHNYITMCWEAGLDPLVTMRIVGHTDYRTTANIYTHLNELHLQNARTEIESVFAAKKNARATRKKSCIKVAQARGHSDD